MKGVLLQSVKRLLGKFDHSLESRFRYLLFATMHSLSASHHICPSCGNKSSTCVSRKYLVTALRRCSRCSLLFRAPTTTPGESERFYQRGYSERTTTDLPSETELEEMKQNLFRSSKSFERYIEVLNQLSIRPGAKIIDFGCSWGYGSWQMAQHGFRITGFEISRERAQYARDRLNIDMVQLPSELEISGYDVFFSSHVLEHVPSVSEVISLSERVLCPGGFFVAFTPNGSLSYRQKYPQKWKSVWGQKHANHLDEVFYQKAFAEESYFISSSPYDSVALAEWVSQRSQYIGNLDGSELLIVARKQELKDD